MSVPMAIQLAMEEGVGWGVDEGSLGEHFTISSSN